MKLSVLKETENGETRVAIVPKSISKLQGLGFEIIVEKDAGAKAAFTDSDYANAGATIASNVSEAIAAADVVVKINPPSSDDIAALKGGQIWLSQLFHRLNEDLIKQLEGKGVAAFSLDAMPRISRAQSMDVLSSQSNLSGYKAVICGADNLGKIFPMLMTAAGTITPSKVLIFGVGVAGLQAIATAKRLGAVVEATDVRQECKEQTESLGAKFITVEDDGVKVEGGYAKEVTEEYLAKQKEAVNKSLAQADLVITTALVQGAKAPVLISQEQIEMMKNGSVIVDMAVAKGGNTALSEADKTVTHNGVKIVGVSNFPAQIPTNASELLSRNIDTFLAHLMEDGNFKWDMEDEITTGTLIVNNRTVAS
ncbi:MAG: Re/Si-specific NAD(P)(+) transhydrogenase subunit alpha [Bacteroidia bacterium]|nr:Re/Si-specific NAD(P)(+) transhydrogenase subunit alpha [Bacteroidia bacterium]NNJ54911.1 Re/Si-specific NAD(P)(+) transhydrogenase subunit alpha [Bacteroidia bacterium]